MAYSYIAYPYNHLQKTYIIPFPFLDRTHVHLHIGGVELEEGIHYEWLTDSSIAILKLPEPSDLAGECETDISTLVMEVRYLKKILINRHSSYCISRKKHMIHRGHLRMMQNVPNSRRRWLNIRQRFLLVSLLSLLIQIQRVLFQIVLLIS